MWRGARADNTCLNGSSSKNQRRNIKREYQDRDQNATASQSQIRDADIASEMSSFVKSQILMQTGVSMLAQANTVPQNVLKLLQ